MSSVVAGLFLATSSATQAAVRNAASPSVADVTAAINSAADGDTVMLPAGTAVWNSTLRITKGISLIGQTSTNPVAKRADDRTIISVATGGNGNQALMEVDTVTGKPYRLSGITFRTGRTGVMDGNGMIRLNGDSHAVRVDHCHFDDLAYEAVGIAVWGPIYGVIDHNLFDYRTTNNQSINIHMSGWGGRDNGDGSWAEPAYYGSEKFVFIEDNCFNNTNGHAGGWIDGWDGGRYVYRYNHSYDSAPANHGTEIGRGRGLRCMEVYNNDFHWNSFHSSVGGVRSGGLITHDNVSYDTQPDRGATMGQFRNFANFTTSPWTQANGTNPWDSNDPHGLYESGTAGSGSTSTQIVDTTKNWRTNRWIGFTAKKVSDGRLGLIRGNTSNTLTVIYDSAHEGVIWAAGDQYQIHKVLITLDQPCRGAGDLITGDNPINSTTGTQAWPHQALEPCYSWNDIYTPTGAHVNITQATGAFAILTEGRDFYNNTPMPGYTPYTYPHPLTKGLPLPEQMKRNATGTSQRKAVKERRPWGGKKLDRKKAKKAKASPTNEMADGPQSLGH
jgi:hypothetical protein